MAIMQKVTGIVAVLLVFALLLAFGCAGAPIKEGVTANGHPYRGSATPKVVIYEYSDFECPFCSKALPAIDEVMRAYPNEVQLQFRHFPLVNIHPRSMPSALAGVCAEKQGKFWQMHDLMFANQEKLEDADLNAYAKEAGLDMQVFAQCLSSQEPADWVNADIAAGAALGIQGTPSFAVGRSVVAGTPKLKQVVDAELAKVR